MRVRYIWHIMHACVCMRLCMYACVMYGFMCLCMYVYICMYVCVYAHMYVCVYVCVHVCAHACVYVCLHVCAYMCVCVPVMWACQYVWMHLCMYGFQAFQLTDLRTLSVFRVSSFRIGEYSAPQTVIRSSRSHNFSFPYLNTSDYQAFRV